MPWWFDFFIFALFLFIFFSVFALELVVLHTRPVLIAICLIAVFGAGCREVFIRSDLPSIESSSVAIFCTIGMAISVLPHWLPHEEIIVDGENVETDNSTEALNLAVFENREDK